MTEKRIQKLIEEAKSSIAKLHDIVLQLDAAVAGENPVGAVILFWKTSWQTVHGAAYTMTAADKGHVKRLVTQLGADDVKARMKNYLNDRDPFLARNKHPLNFFVSRINQYAELISMHPPELPDEIPADCRHDPPCRSDADHTRKRAAEMRS